MLSAQGRSSLSTQCSGSVKGVQAGEQKTKAKISTANKSGVNLSGWCNWLVGQLSQSRTRPVCSCQWQWQEPKRRRFYHVTSCPGCVRALILFWAMLVSFGYSYILTLANHFKQMLGVLCAKKYIPSMQSLATTLTSRPS